jgi:hypothetical protein
MFGYNGNTIGVRVAAVLQAMLKHESLGHQCLGLVLKNSFWPWTVSLFAQRELLQSCSPDFFRLFFTSRKAHSSVLLAHSF